MVQATTQFLDAEGKLQKTPSEMPSKELLKRALHAMVTTRIVDERMITLQRQGKITFALSSLGEEACAVGAALALQSEDWIYPQYRETGAFFARGGTIQEYVHGMFCNAADRNKGRQMPNHFGSKELNIVTVSSPIATKIPHAVGCAYAMKLQKEQSCALTFFGEGATSEGDFHAALNFASVLDVPCIFFCRNNRYAISTPVESQFASDGIFPKAEGYGMAAERIDGNDLIAVYDAVKRARRAKKPVLIEAMTYRRGAHSTSDDPSRYREGREEEEAKKSDPIERLEKYLGESVDEKALRDAIDEAIRQAEEAGPPQLATMIEEVYFETPGYLKRQLDEVRAL